MLKSVKLLIFPTILFFALSLQISAQPVALDFNLKVNGFQFKNYRNEGERWKNDLGDDDLIRMFGAETMCKKRNRNSNQCVEKVDTKPWLEKYLKAMNVGHCEGIAVASLRMKSSLPFKQKTQPAQFQRNATSVFSLQRDEQLENYIAYYWITQTFDEVSIPTKETAEKGPVFIAKTLIEGFKARRDTFVLRFWKSANHIPDEGHAVAPFAVEETSAQYIISVYDNNYPGQIRYVYINKNARQDWNYTSKKTNDYTGNLESQTLELTPTSLRDGKCFDPPWAFDSNQRTGCGQTASILNQPVFTNASFSNLQDSDGEDAEFFITGEGNVLITDNGSRIGYDENNQFYDEVSDGNFIFLIGGLGVDIPHFTLPYNPDGEDYIIEFSGKNLDAESMFDFVFSAPGVRANGNQPGSPGFTIGFNDILLDPDEILTATLSRDGSKITFTTSGTDTETPEVYYAYDPQNNDEPSYEMTIGGIELNENTTLTYDIDFVGGTLLISDDDGNEDNYDIELIRLEADGTTNQYNQNDLDIGDADKYEMDFGDWKGEGDTMCFKDDDDGDGFEDEGDCEEQADEPDEDPSD